MTSRLYEGPGGFYATLAGRAVTVRGGPFPEDSVTGVAKVLSSNTRSFISWVSQHAQGDLRGIPDGVEDSDWFHFSNGIARARMVDAVLMFADAGRIPITDIPLFCHWARCRGLDPTRPRKKALEAA